MAETVMPFDLEAFIEGVNKDCTKEKGTNNSIKRVVMNSRGNQGSITILPFISKKIGNIYVKLENVREINGPTSIIDAPDGAWYRLLPKEFYGELNEKESELYDEVSGLYDDLVSWDYANYDTLRKRNYSIFTGICLNHTNVEGAQVEGNIDQPCLVVFPSNSPIDALNTAISTKRNILKERTVQWLQGIITPNNTGRKGAIVITFKKSDGPGYTSSVSFETNNLDEGTIIVDPAKEFGEDIVSKFDDPIHTFLGWCYDYDNKKYFCEKLFLEMRDVIKGYIDEAAAYFEKKAQQEAGNAPTTEGAKSEMPPVPGASPKPSGRPF
jgi:hypothetical protein